MMVSEKQQADQLQDVTSRWTSGAAVAGQAGRGTRVRAGVSVCLFACFEPNGHLRRIYGVATGQQKRTSGLDEVSLSGLASCQDLMLGRQAVQARWAVMTCACFFVRTQEGGTAWHGRTGQLLAGADGTLAGVTRLLCPRC